MATTLYRENNERAYCHEECCAGFGQEELHPWRCSIVEQVATQLEERKKRFKFKKAVRAKSRLRDTITSV